MAMRRESEHEGHSDLTVRPRSVKNRLTAEASEGTQEQNLGELRDLCG